MICAHRVRVVPDRDVASECQESRSRPTSPHPRSTHAGQDPSRRRHRRQPHPVRPLEHRLRRRLQPGDAHRRDRRAGRRATGSRASGSARSSPARCSSTRRDFNLTRESVLGSRLSPETPAYDIQQACDTGIQAAIQVANKIALGQIEVGIAGGTDTTSDAPIALNEKLRKILLEANRAKTTAGPPRRAGQGPPAAPRPVDPAEQRAAHRPVDGRVRRADRAGVGHRARRRRTSWRWRSHHNLAASYDARLPGRPGDAVPRPRARPEPARRLVAGEARRRSSRCSARARPRR